MEAAADRATARFQATVAQPLGGPAPSMPAPTWWSRGGGCASGSRYLDDGVPLDSDDADRLLVAMVSIEVRDVAWSLMDRSSAARHVSLWRDLVLRSPRDLAAAPAALLGFAAWLSGDGALAWCAVERCQESEPATGSLRSSARRSRRRASHRRPGGRSPSTCSPCSPVEAGAVDGWL